MTAAVVPARRWRTRAHRAWRALRDGLDDQQTATVLACVALAIAGALGALVWGQAAVNVALGVALLWALTHKASQDERIDQAADDADRAVQQANEARAESANALAQARVIREHLEGREPEQTGRHVRRAA